MPDIIDLAQERTQEIINDRIDNIQSEIRRTGVIDGFCEDCDELVPQQRLLAVPWARRCVACQEIYESERRRR